MKILALLLLIMPSIVYGMNSMGDLKRSLRERYEKPQTPSLRSTSEGFSRGVDNTQKCDNVHRIRREALSPKVEHKKSE
jgi:hypothetical protein